MQKWYKKYRKSVWFAKKRVDRLREAAFSFLFHQYLDIEQLFPICLSAFFAGDAPEVLPDFVVQGFDFGGLGVGDWAKSGLVHITSLRYKRKSAFFLYYLLHKCISILRVCQVSLGDFSIFFENRKYILALSFY